MFTKLRTKLFLGLVPLLIIMVALGLWAVAILDQLGGEINVILRENYESILAAEAMKSALGRMDLATQLAIQGLEEESRKQFRDNKQQFDLSLARERCNITLPGEQELVDRLSGRYGRYLGLVEEFYALAGAGDRRRLATSRLSAASAQIWDAAEAVLQINQVNMRAEDRKSREAADRSKRVMIIALLGSTAGASIIAVVLSRSLLGPIQAVTRSSRALARGDYDQIVPVTSRDELGELASTCNALARTLREFRQAGTERLVRAQQTAQATIDSFPDPVVVLDPAGAIERANPAARRLLGGVAPDGPVPWAPPQLRAPIADVLRGLEDYRPTGLEQALCLRDDGQERFYLPAVLAIRGNERLIGAAVVFHDVTKFRLVDQLKNDMVATVSHELKTPLTSVQMTVHLLLEEAVGPLAPQQVELLLAARQDSDRLLAMINDLLDLTRIEQGRVMLDLLPTAAADLVAGAIGRFEAMARDAGIELTGGADGSLPRVLVDRERIEHVFDNLISNALAKTERAGSIRLSADRDGDQLRFDVTDNGGGIPPASLPRIFERFYRVPGSRPGGAGLGLPIAREIVLGHGGRIEALSELGRGTTFSIHLPVAPVDVGEAG